MNKKLILILLIFLALNVSANTITFYDTWTSNGGDNFDAKLWGGYWLDVTAQGINSQADCLCWDWCDDGSPDDTIANWDACQCKSTTARNQCMSYSPTLVTPLCNGGNCVVNALSTYWWFNTYSSGYTRTCGVDVREYRDCDNSSGVRGIYNWLDVDGDPYYIVAPKKYDCDNSSVYDFEGQFTNNSTLYEIDITSNNSCPSNRSCDEDSGHLNHDDQLISSATGSIPDPCSIVDGSGSGSQCSNNNECLSGNCGGNRQENLQTCVSDGSNGINVDTANYSDSCGGSGYYQGQGGMSTTCTIQMSSNGYVCDADLDNINTTNSLSPSTYCKRDEYWTCSASSQCWNDNGGYDCLGTASISKVCTTGANGRSCTTTDWMSTLEDDAKCYSGRCDVTCQAQLPNNVSCNEDSDCQQGVCASNGLCGLTNGAYCVNAGNCQSNICSNNTCGGGSLPNGAVCSTDMDCTSRYCIYDTPSQAHCSASHDPVGFTTDTWIESNSNNQSTYLDGIAFTGTTVKAVTYNLRQSTDMLCYDFEDDGTYDACYYDTVNGCNGSSCNANSCDYFSAPTTVPSSKKFGCNIDSFDGCEIGTHVPAEICSGSSCSVNSNNRQFGDLRVRGFYDCDNSDNLRSQATIPEWGSGDDYWIVNPKYYYCSNQSAPGAGYRLRAAYGSGASEYVQVGNPYSCPSNESCSILVDQQNVTSASGVIPNPCKRDVGASCSSNSQCMYNVCQSNSCANGFIYQGQLQDELTNALPNYTVKLTTCSNSVIATTQTDSLGRFNFAYATGNYKLKFVVPWGELVGVNASGNSCMSFGSGFLNVLWTMNTQTDVRGRAVDPQGSPSVGLPFSLTTCQDNPLTSTTTNSNGDFLLTSQAGYQKLKVNINGNLIPITNSQGNACFLNYGQVDYGTMELTNNCSLYNNTCYDEDTRLFNCSANAQYGCACNYELCQAGCTNLAPQCNAVGTGTIHVIVTDENRAVKNADVWINNAYKGKTNGFGKKEVNMEHGSYSVSMACADGSHPDSQTLYLGGNHAYAYFDADCINIPKGKLLVSTHTNTNLPLANAQVLLNNEVVGITNPLGFLYIEDLEYGSHILKVRYKITNESTPGVFQRTTLVDMNQSQVNVDLTLYKPNQAGFGPSGTETLSENLWPLVFAVADVASVSWSTNDLCKCIYNTEETTQQVLACDLEMSPCSAQMAVGYGAFPVVALMPLCVDTIKQYYPDIKNRCLKQGLYLAGDIASPFIPIHLIGAGIGFVANTVIDLKLFGKILRTERKYGNIVEFVAENEDHIIAEAIDNVDLPLKVKNVGIKPSVLGALGRDGADAAYDAVAAKVGKEIAKDRLGKVTQRFGESTMQEVYESIGEMTQSTLYDPNKIRWLDSFSDATKNFNPTSQNSISYASGEIKEILVTKRFNLISQTRIANWKKTINGVDVEIDNISSGFLREFKSPATFTKNGNSVASITQTVEGQLARFESARPSLQAIGESFTGVKYYVVRYAGESLPSNVITALDNLKTSTRIADWQEVII